MGTILAGRKDGRISSHNNIKEVINDDLKPAVVMKFANLYDLYCCPHVAILFRSYFGGWGESTIKLLLKIHQYLCNPTTYERFALFLYKIQASIFKIAPVFEKSSGKSL